MTIRRVVRLLAAVLALAGLAVLLPMSPLFLPNLLVTKRHYDGRSAREWIRHLDSPDREARLQAINALGRIGKEAPEAVPLLARALAEEEDSQLRGEAALALSKMNPASVDALAELTAAVADQHPLVRMNAVRALSNLREQARPAIPALIKAYADKNNQTNLARFTYTIQDLVVQTLGRASAGSDEAVPTLLEALTAGETDSLRRSAAQALGDVGPRADRAVPLLQKMLTDRNEDIRHAAHTALTQIQGKPPEGPPPKKEAPAAPERKLSAAQRQYLWDVEHHGNVLVKHGFGPMAQALRGGNAAALARLLADDFRGAEPAQPRRVRLAAGGLQVERLEDAGLPTASLGRDAFVGRLLEWRRPLGDAARVQLSLMTLGPKARGQFDGPWEGTAQLRLFGDRKGGGPAEVVVHLGYEVARPTTEALARPGWLRAARVLQVLDGRAPRFLFADVARQRGLDVAGLHDNWTAEPLVPTTGGVYVADFNRDGFLDVLVTDYNGSTLYQGGKGGAFTDVTERCGLPRLSHDRVVAAWVDIDGDGWDDLILGGRVFRNDAGRRFVDYTDRCRLRLPADAQNIVVADYDRDGRLDLYVTRACRGGNRSWLDGRSEDPGGNHLFRNQGGWRFEDVTAASGTLGGHRSTFTAAWLDANDDGWPDLHVINEFGDGVLLINQGDGTFAGRRLADRPADFGSMGLAVGDVDNDGHIDIYCANMYSKAGTRVMGNLAADAYPANVMATMRRFVAGSQLHLNRGGLRFEQVGKPMQVAAVGWAYGTCLADLDNDGWLDIYATAGFVSRDRDEADG